MLCNEVLQIILQNYVNDIHVNNVQLRESMMHHNIL